MKKILLIFIICNFFTVPSFSMTQEEMEGFTYVDFYDFITSYNTRKRNVVGGAYDDKKIDISSSSFITYLNPPEKYITYLEYRGAIKNVSIYQKPFLLDWFKVSNSSYKNNNSTAESILADTNFELFFDLISYSIRGKSYFIATQKAIGNDMAENLKIGDLIRVYLLNLGQYDNSDTPVFLIIAYEKATEISQAIKDKMYFQQYLPILKNDILNRRYDKAKGKVELLLKTYPNNLELKLNLCLIYNKTNFFEKSINCYTEVLEKSQKNYNAYYGLAVAYYNDGKNRTNKTLVAKNIIKNATKSINLIDNLTTRPQGSMAMIYYNALYLRAIAKIEIKDETAIDDLEEVHENQPTLISSDSIDKFKKFLGL